MRKLFVFIYLHSILFAGGFRFAKYAGDFLHIGVGGRALGMGGAFVSVANDVTAGYWNPAGLSGISSLQFMLMHDERFAGTINYDYFGIALPYFKSGYFGFSILRLGIDDIPDTRNAVVNYGDDWRIDPDKITYFSSSDWIFMLSYAKFIKSNLSFGGTVKLIYRKLGENSGFGAGFDLGLKYTVSKLAFGVVFKDAVSTLISWDTGRTELVVPSVVSGLSYNLDVPGGSLTPSVDFVFRFEGRRKESMLGSKLLSLDLNAGVEYMFKNTAGLRFGYTENGEFTLGAGLKLGRMVVDYSFARFVSGNTHRISVKFILKQASI